jgi:ABC-type transport system involved in multi-copper enzyme maturation permease subunit
MSSIVRVWTIAANTIREAIRSKLLYTLLFFAVLMICAGVLLSTLSYVESERILQDVGFASIRLFGVAIAIFVGVGLIHREVDRRTVYTILSKPLSRAEFLLGKYLGLVLTIWMQMVIMVVAFCLVSFLTGAGLGAAHFASFALTGMELALVVAVATLFSAFTTPMLASFYSCGLWIVGQMTRDLASLGAQSELSGVKFATAAIHRVFPDLESFNLSTAAVHGLPFTSADVWLPTLYAAGYIVILLFMAVTIFERRDFR